jgi:hypothetical protein
VKKIFILIICIATVFSCQEKQEPGYSFSGREISQVLAKMTDVMVYDVTNPPLAGRFFSYACLAGYEVMSQHDSSYQSMYGRLQEYPHIEMPAGISGYSVELSALLAMLETAGNMQPSGTMIEEYKTQFLDSCRENGMPEAMISQSLQYAQAISQDILAYAKADRYNKISNYPRYTPLEEEGSWYPTPPGFFAPVEPHFNTIRPFTLLNFDQFKPQAPAAFSLDKNSEFYRLLKEVYLEAGTDLSEEEKEIAAFWDCNPFALQDNGHLMIGMKKISPGAHWLGIAGIACKDAGLDFAETMKINTLVAITLMDGFIACWDEKFRSNRIRPETAIRKHLDPAWQPLLQTPPFPEYLSGHSTISSASAVVLTHFFGEDFNYTDTVEERYGLAARSFSSFHEAAREASVSRLYGGIHFNDAIVNGQEQGFQVGEWILKTVEGKTSAEEQLAEN